MHPSHWIFSFLLLVLLLSFFLLLLPPPSSSFSSLLQWLNLSLSWSLTLVLPSGPHSLILNFSVSITVLVYYSLLSFALLDSFFSVVFSCYSLLWNLLLSVTPSSVVSPCSDLSLPPLQVQVMLYFMSSVVTIKQFIRISFFIIYFLVLLFK